MRVVFFGNNRLAVRVAAWLREQGEDIAALVLHPPGKRRCGEELLEAAGLSETSVLDGSRLGEDRVVESLRDVGAEMGVSVLFGHIVPARVLDLFPRGVVNLHPAYLPYNRGAYPNVWSIVDGTPAGATLHHMDEELDRGDVIAQRRIDADPRDTGESLYRRLEEASYRLFVETWPEVAAGRAGRTPQEHGEATAHRVRDVKGIDEIDLDAPTTARRCLDVIRARTFPPHPGAYFVAGGRKHYLRLEIVREDEMDGPEDSEVVK